MKANSLNIGVATYTLRMLPTDAAITILQRLAVKTCSLKDSHLPMKATPDELKAIVAKFKAAGITPLSCGNVGMKNDEADVRAAFEYAKAAGIGTMVCAPPLDAIPLLDKMVKEYDIKLALHNHGPEDKNFPTPYEAYNAAKGFDKRIGLCVDVGHCARAGKDPAKAILDCRDRVYDIHLKDVSVVAPNGKPIEVGRGGLDIASILKALIAINFTGNVGFEYEKDAKDPVLGLAESVGYVRGILKGL
ncbi:sugar phosphate isomerase/epimerase family protein [Armatimonas sp.]|uniref:sugar phosphate isomerase/epimerase family protein n=1 Tax=Armatimonas sp. TaxID=1872638 RepID=UPI00374FE1D9